MGEMFNTCVAREAITIVRPAVEAMLRRPETNWGPDWVAVGVDHPDFEEPVIVVIGEELWWDTVAWGEEKDLRAIAQEKMDLAGREGMPTGMIVACYPERLRPGDTTYQGGYAEEAGGLRTAASGAYGQTDEGIARMIFGVIQMLCQLEVRRMKERDQVYV